MPAHLPKTFSVARGSKVRRNGGRGGFELRGNLGPPGVVEVEGVARKRTTERVWACALLVASCTRGHAGAEKVRAVGERTKAMIHR
jgi:hypothetical protein